MKSFFKTALMLLALLLPATASAHDFEVDGIYYNFLDDEGSVGVARPPVKYSGDVTIPDAVNYDGTTYSVTAIGDSAFFACEGLSSVTIGGSVTTIGKYAFWSCSNLMAVNIPNSVTTLGVEAFSYCTGLTSVTIPQSVTSIGVGAFLKCYRLTSINVESGNTAYDSRDNCNAIIETATNTLIAGCQSTMIPNTVTAIGNYAFGLITDLGYVDLPNSVTSIGVGAFNGCGGLTKVTIPNSVTTVGNLAFYQCSDLTSVTIGNSVTTIGNSAFYGCWNMTSLTMGNSVSTIGDLAFAYCPRLTNLTIPGTVTSIGEEAFMYCSRVTDMYSYIPDLSRLSVGDNAFYSSGDDYLARTLHVVRGTADAYQADENWYPYFGQIVEDLMPVEGLVAFTGVMEHPVIEVTPDKSTGLDKIFVVYEIGGVGMTYRSLSGEQAVWYRFDSQGSDSAEEIPGISSDGVTTTLSQVLPNTGYKIVEGDCTYHCWVVNYADYYMELNDLFINTEDPCDLLTLNIDGRAVAIPYYTVNGNRQVLDREIKLKYSTLEWDGAYYEWQEREIVESFADLDQGIEVVPPLCGTCFWLRGDRFLEMWGIEMSLESSYFETQAVDCRTNAIQKNDGEFTNGSLVGCAPVDIVFMGYPTDAVANRVWEIATDPEFKNVILQFNQDEVEHAFHDVGTFYVRYRVANATGTCDACGDTYIVRVIDFGKLPCDVNRDGHVDIADVNTVIDVISGYSDMTTADVNGDGEVTIADINDIIHRILGKEHEWVDLGLPSGTLWATCNVGANSPEEYGDYFAWGETSPKSVYQWENYKWCNGSARTLTKYCTDSTFGYNGFVDGKTELDPEDDAAYVNWGPSWRMPSKEQRDELIAECSWTWTAMNGVNGQLVIGPNGNALFLPAANYGDLEIKLGNAGSFGNYWFRTLSPSETHWAFVLHFSSDLYTGYGYRSSGYSVRAVRATQE